MQTPVYYDADRYISIYQGNSYEFRDLFRKVGAALLLTDPPYGISHQTDYARKFSGGADVERSVHEPVEGDDEPFDPRPWLGLARESVLFGANCFSDKLPMGSWLIWDKRTPGGNKNVMSDGESAWYSRGSGIYIFNHTWDGFNRASERHTNYHPTQKPVALMRWVLQRCSKPGDLIIDPFMGSGPVAKACADMGRRYIGVEKKERYVEVAIQRLQQSAMLLEVG